MSAARTSGRSQTDRDPDLGVFALARKCPLYVVGDFIVPAQPVTMLIRGRPLTSLSAWYREISQQFSDDTLVRARDCANRIGEMTFCLCRLVPYLRFLATRDLESMPCPPGLKEALAELARTAAELRPRLAREKTVVTIPLGQLQKIFSVPCKVDGDQVIPMDIVSQLMRKLGDISIRGAYYRPHKRAARALSEAISEVKQAIQASAIHENRAGDSTKEAAVSFLKDVESILARFNPQSAGQYTVVYSDANHQLQFGRGIFALVRGPLRTRNKLGRTYVGLPIRGCTRQEWLATRPICSKTPQALWTAQGVPVQNQSPCMGRNEQFSHLRSHAYSDEAALVDWLDAGVAIVTKRTAYHRERLRFKQATPRPTMHPSSNRVVLRCI
jgi:hypothetical protein